MKMLQTPNIKVIRKQRAACKDTKTAADLKRSFRGVRNLYIKSRRGTN